MKIDKSSPKLKEQLARGKVFPTVKLDVQQRGSRDYQTCEFRDVRIESSSSIAESVCKGKVKGQGRGRSDDSWKVEEGEAVTCLEVKMTATVVVATQTR